ncbi:KipI antagonist [Opitutaceae bacterium EW11]|nr:KipI antagonist [Opitutaceae bacterium EW11]
MRLSPLGDSAVLIESQLPLGVASDWVRQWIRALESDLVPGVSGIVGGAKSVAVFYQPADVSRSTEERPFQSICRWIESRASVLQSASAAAPREFFHPEDFAGLAPLSDEGAPAEVGASASESAPTMVVKNGGSLTTVQDLGRGRFRNRGVPVGGALDRLALRVANLLAGNPESAAGLEISGWGPSLVFSAPTWVAICGAPVKGLPGWQPWLVQPGEMLTLSEVEGGARSYLAVAGGVVVPSLLGSGSTHLPGGVGGHEGRALREGDCLRIGPSTTNYSETGHWSMAKDILPRYEAAATVRVLPGPQAGLLTPEGRKAFEAESFVVLPESDRGAVRLNGVALEASQGADIPLEPMTEGAVYLRSDGLPAVAMADSPVIGVRPKLGYVITVDLPILAQLKPGDSVRFTPCEEADAEALLLAREHALAKLKEGLAGKRSA